MKLRLYQPHIRVFKSCSSSSSCSILNAFQKPRGRGRARGRGRNVGCAYVIVCRFGKVSFFDLTGCWFGRRLG
ncbi:hypothetical protein D1AOALGA4SA_4156 [Olavius algarvensis Delta 1 endosymbiont]|nr:hypothetical protein D1AOALGA4SA_4156 [Olavius algarvensis Delta 1 endosymbiont]